MESLRILTLCPLNFVPHVYHTLYHASSRSGWYVYDVNYILVGVRVAAITDKCIVVTLIHALLIKLNKGCSNYYIYLTIQ